MKAILILYLTMNSRDRSIGCRKNYVIRMDLRLEIKRGSLRLSSNDQLISVCIFVAANQSLMNKIKYLCLID